jgi:hypothetical protein
MSFWLLQKTPRAATHSDRIVVVLGRRSPIPKIDSIATGLRSLGRRQATAAAAHAALLDTRKNTVRCAPSRPESWMPPPAARDRHRAGVVIQHHVNNGRAGLPRSSSTIRLSSVWSHATYLSRQPLRGAAHFELVAVNVRVVMRRHQAGVQPVHDSRTTSYDVAGHPCAAATSDTARCTSAIRGGGRRSAKPSVTSRATGGSPRSERRPVRRQPPTSRPDRHTRPLSGLCQRNPVEDMWAQHRHPIIQIHRRQDSPPGDYKRPSTRSAKRVADSSAVRPWCRPCQFDRLQGRWTFFLGIREQWGRRDRREDHGGSVRIDYYTSRTPSVRRPPMMLAHALIRATPLGTRVASNRHAGCPHRSWSAG